MAALFTDYSRVVFGCLGDDSEVRMVGMGGTGLIESNLLAKLPARGHEAVPASLNPGVNTLTGEGLADVLEGASVVVDVTSSPSLEGAAALKFFDTSTRNLLTYEAAASVRHHVALSVVGADRLPESGYFRAKIAQEKWIKQSPIPYSIVRATQFFEFVKRIADDGEVAGVVHVAPALIQPIASDDVTTALCRVAADRPLNTSIDIAHPDRVRMDHFIRPGLDAAGDPRDVVADPHARYFSAELGEYSLLPGEGARLGETRFDDWIAATTRPNPQLAAATMSKDR